MANQYGIDMGNVLAAKRYKDERDERDQKTQQARVRNNLLTGLRTGVMNGDESSMRALTVFDPAEANALMGAMERMDKKEKERYQQLNESVGRISAWILQSENPEQAYNTARSSFPEEMQAQMPEQYNEQFVRLQLAKTMELDKIMSNPQKITSGENDELWRNGERISSTRSQNALNADYKAQQDAAEANAPPEMGSGDESLMYRQAVELLGGLFDQQGNIQALDPNNRARAQSIAVEATKLFKRGGMTRSQAVQQAASQLGVSFNDPNAARPGNNAMNPQRQIPPQAIEFLRQNPSPQNRAYFQQYYGVAPDEYLQ